MKLITGSCIKSTKAAAGLLLIVPAVFTYSMPGKKSAIGIPAVAETAALTDSSSGAMPMQIINGLPYIKILVNGKGPYLFGFDSGFGAEMELDSALANEIGVKPSGKTTIGDGSGKTVVLDVGIVNEVAIGKKTMHKVNAIIRNSPRKQQLGMENVKGILGIGMFPGQKVILDYPRFLFSVEDGDLAAANGKDIFDYTPVGGGIPEIEIKVGNLKVKAVVDSRSMSAEFKIPQDIAEKLTHLSEPKVIGKGRTVSSVIDITEVKIKESIQLGQYIYAEPVITYPSLNESAIIGSKLLKKFVVIIDSRNKRIQLTKGEMPETSGSLSEYTGSYAGGRTISAEGDFLYIQRPNGAVLKMISNGKDEFTLELVPNAVLKFDRDSNNRIISVKVSKGDGNWETAAKEK